MKRFLLGILFGIFCLSAVHAQGENKEPDWQALDSPREGFYVEFPAKYTNRDFGGNKADSSGGLYASVFNRTYYFVRTASEKNKQFFDVIRNYIVSNQADNSAEIVGGLNSSVYTFQDKDGYYNRILEIKTKQRTYFFHTLSETENNPEVARFFDSIVIGDKTEKTALPTDEKPIAPVRTDKIRVPVPVPNSADENGDGTGAKTYSVDGVGDGGARPVQAPGQISLLKILSKPRVAYTEIARLHMITGKVRLRVTFLENGQIGDVTPLSRLPFGLTRNAVEVARQIRFEPATKDGQPVAVTKLVEYNFNIY
jgi:TonB family protein